MSPNSPNSRKTSVSSASSNTGVKDPKTAKQSVNRLASTALASSNAPKGTTGAGSKATPAPLVPAKKSGDDSAAKESAPVDGGSTTAPSAAAPHTFVWNKLPASVVSAPESSKKDEKKGNWLM